MCIPDAGGQKKASDSLEPVVVNKTLYGGWKVTAEPFLWPEQSILPLV